MKVLTRGLDDTDRKILSLLKEGKTYKQISSIIYLSIPSIKYRILAMRKEYGCENKIQLLTRVLE